MAKSSEHPPGAPPKSGRDPAKHSKKDPAKPTRAKAARPDLQPLEPALAQLLNPGIEKGTAGVGSQTGIAPRAAGTAGKGPAASSAEGQRTLPAPLSARPVPTG